MKDSGAQKFIDYLDVQGPTQEKLIWLAATCGRQQDEIDKLKQQVAILKAARTKEKHKKVRQ